MKHKDLTSLFLFLFLGFSAYAEPIKLSNPNLQITGAKYLERNDEEIIFYRHSKEILALPKLTLAFSHVKAVTSTGVILSFKTAASAQLTFTKLQGEHRGAEFGVFKDGELVKHIKKLKKNETVEISISSSGNAASFYEVTLPSLSNYKLSSMNLEGGELLPFENKKPVYVAFGDSISHGTGQGSATHLTYPFKLSRLKNHELYNMAVGGGKVSVPAASLLEDFDQVDLITMLIGYNDWNGIGKTAEQFAADYKAFIDEVRIHQPNTTFVCITPAFTRNLKSKKTGLPIEVFRKAVVAEVTSRQEQGDKNIYLVHGPEISSEENLNEANPKDPVHFGIKGAELFAQALYQELEGLLK